MTTPSTTNQLKPIPTIATRADIYSMYSQVPRIQVRIAIQYAIDTVDARKKYSPNIKVLNSRHITIIMNELGNAPGYVAVEEK